MGSGPPQGTRSIYLPNALGSPRHPATAGRRGPLAVNTASPCTATSRPRAWLHWNDEYDALAVRRARLRGRDDRGALRARAGLGSALTAAGRAAEAVELLDALVADQDRVLGADHPDLFASRFFQAWAYVMAERAG
jgi:Tetratricopeptide repeat